MPLSVRRPRPPLEADLSSWALRPAAAGFARAAGVTGVVANLLLVAMFASFRVTGVQENSWSWTGPANDLVGAVSNALMIPAGWYLARGLPARAGVRTAHRAGVAAMVVLAASGAALVLGLVPFEASTAVTIAALMV